MMRSRSRSETASLSESAGGRRGGTVEKSSAGTVGIEQTLLDTFGPRPAEAGQPRLPEEAAQPYRSNLPDYGAAPGFDGATGWLNAAPLQAEELRGKVVLVNFWTYSCINCIRTLPYVRAWAEKYKDRGLVVVGVHTPEFAFEKKVENIFDSLDTKDVKAFGFAFEQYRKLRQSGKGECLFNDCLADAATKDAVERAWVAEELIREGLKLAGQTVFRNSGGVMGPGQTRLWDNKVFHGPNGSGATIFQGPWPWLTAIAPDLTSYEEFGNLESFRPVPGGSHLWQNYQYAQDCTFAPDPGGKIVANCNRQHPPPAPPGALIGNYCEGGVHYTHANDCLRIPAQKPGGSIKLRGFNFITPTVKVRIARLGDPTVHRQGIKPFKQVEPLHVPWSFLNASAILANCPSSVASTQCVGVWTRQPPGATAGSASSRMVTGPSQTATNRSCTASSADRSRGCARIRMSGLSRTRSTACLACSTIRSRFSSAQACTTLRAISTANRQASDSIRPGRSAQAWANRLTASTRYCSCCLAKAICSSARRSPSAKPRSYSCARVEEARGDPV